MRATTTSATQATRHEAQLLVQSEVGNHPARPAGHGGLLDAHHTESRVGPAACSLEIDTAASVAAPSLGVFIRKAPKLVAVLLGLRLRLLQLRAQIAVLALKRPDLLTKQGQVLAQHRRRAALVNQRLNLLEKKLHHFILQKPATVHGSEGGAA